MKRTQFYRSLLLAMFFVAFVVLNVFLVGRRIYSEYKVEKGFRQEYGVDWKDRYDHRYGPGSLDRAQNRIKAGCVGIPVISILLWLIYRQATADRSGGARPPRKKSHQKNQW